MENRTPTRNSHHGNQIAVRLATADDAWHIALLCNQLGYAVSREDAQQRLRQIQQDDLHAIYVAGLSGGHVVGWIHVFLYQSPLNDSQAEIGGLVVDEGRRRCGVGSLLMQQAERWACGKGCRAVYLRSNVVRKDARAFYKKIGYSNIKTQLAFRKVL